MVMGFKGSYKAKCDSLGRSFERFSARFPRLYISFLCLFAFIGYGFVFLFPGLTIFSFNSIYEILFSENDINWQLVLLWFVVLLFSAQLTYRMIVTRPVPAVGFTMPESKIPKVYSMVAMLQSHFKRPAIQRIIISANYEVDIVKTPRWMLPIWSTNTLVIGLPLLICLTPQQFEHMVARRIGQFSKRHNMVSNWLYQLNSIWEQYSYIYAKQKSLESKALQLFFMVYSFIYKRLSVSVARLDEFNADDYAMQLYNHEDICEMITADALSRWYLAKRFWPAIEKAYSAKNKNTHQPFKKLVTVIPTNLKNITDDLLIKLSANEVVERSNRLPSLQKRLERIGYNIPQMKKYTGESAADCYLGSSLNGSLNLMDKLWLKNNQKKKNKKKSIKERLIPVFKNG
jgi:Zn-dependent protease with chaperone function